LKLLFLAFCDKQYTALVKKPPKVTIRVAGRVANKSLVLCFGRIRNGLSGTEFQANKRSSQVKQSHQQTLVKQNP
jgi:hypothetical protein